jgi:hypothetical protein
MEYPTRVKPQPQPVDRVERPKQSLEQWTVDLCVCRECRDGFVSMEVKGYSTLFACPLCDRQNRDLYPYQAIPSAKKWEGKYSTYTDAEMALRKANRRDVVDSLRKGAARQPELQVEGVLEPF